MEETAKVKTIIANDISIVGTVKCESDIQFDGNLEGDLNCSGRATIGKSAVVKGNTSVDSISVMGQIDGNITAKDRIELKSTARVKGDIKAKRLTVEDGVTFIGRSEVNPAGVSMDNPQARKTAEPLAGNQPQNQPQNHPQNRK